MVPDLVLLSQLQLLLLRSRLLYCPRQHENSKVSMYRYSTRLVFLKRQWRESSPAHFLRDCHVHHSDSQPSHPLTPLSHTHADVPTYPDLDYFPFLVTNDSLKMTMSEERSQEFQSRYQCTHALAIQGCRTATPSHGLALPPDTGTNSATARTTSAMISITLLTPQETNPPRVRQSTAKNWRGLGKNTEKAPPSDHLNDTKWRPLAK